MSLKLNAKSRLLATDDMTVKGPVEMVFANKPPIKFKNALACENATWTSKGKAIGGTSAGSRIGQYSCVRTMDGDMGVARIYPTRDRDPVMRIEPDSQYWEVSIKDRTRQIEEVLADMQRLKHPLYEQVKADGDAEIRGFELRKNAAPRRNIGQQRPVGDPNARHASKKPI